MRRVRERWGYAGTALPSLHYGCGIEQAENEVLAGTSDAETLDREKQMKNATSTESSARCEIPCGSPEAPTCLCEKAFDRGAQAGALYRDQGYGKVHGAYPSNPYHADDPRRVAFDTGYEEAVNGR